VTGVSRAGAAPWLEAPVVACHMIPAVLLIAAWVLLVRGVFSTASRPEAVS
jgi:hypothetical protein